MSKPADNTKTAKTAEQEAAAKEAGAKAAAEQDAAKDKPAELKPWQLEEWTGPLTADQAAWRREHIKPVGEVKTK